VGLFLLRSVVGLTAFVHGWRLLANPEVEPALAWGIGAPATCIGVALAIGFLTPIAAALVGVGTSCVALGWVPAHVFGPIDSTFTAVLLIDTCIAMVLLGPGALSLDARMFGRREIVISREARALDR
jgi:uncharacterized membrane protein YphA (DoxX/SURF4 family)